ncbi:MarR family transcriptional regulator [Janibacter hoylei PVAS-1]|uniref:MarR family transcriptional regulator n=1 Tax=Janibacter hoylei PVAS-1 TaxID=1210046 RepID=K1E548_9MICO|nr:MarR family transcriptional regulator [Janibacter hoylei]EKA60532.1 MarR family transcriptional regulator [Janibacter hoylei PVAS-1]
MHTTNPTVAVQLQETLGQVFGLFSKMIARRQALDPQAMSRTDYALLGTLAHCPTEAGIRISKLAESLGHDLSTISRRVSHLETHGLLERLPDPSDGRASTVRLSGTASRRSSTSAAPAPASSAGCSPTGRRRTSSTSTVSSPGSPQILPPTRSRRRTPPSPLQTSGRTAS